MSDLSILIKPVSGLCNLACNYCFYLEQNCHHNHTKGVMTEDTMIHLIQAALNDQPNHISFVFQGGEPLLIGEQFYEKFIHNVNKLNTKNIPISYSIQTNGTILSDRFIQLFREHDFLVGVSLDGYRSIHDKNRLTIDGQSSFQKTLITINTLKENKIPFNILSVVTHAMLHDADGIYMFLSRLGTEYLQFIPYVHPLDDIMDTKFLTPKEYGSFLIQLFDAWYNDVINNKNIVSIRFFDDIIKILLGYRPESCTMSGNCIIQNVVESDGSVFPCDFYVQNKWRLGNIVQNSLSDIRSSQKAKQFIQTSFGLSEECNTCNYQKLCFGGCRRNKPQTNALGSEKTTYCQSYKSLFDQRLDGFIELTQKILHDDL
jgi:uncharacterized protein